MDTQINQWTRRSVLMALLLPLMLSLALSTQAQTKRVPMVAILEFGVTPQSGSPAILGRSATDAVALEMTRTGRFDSIPRASLEKQIKDSDFPVPLSRNDVQRLGQMLGADYVVYGTVQEIVFTENPRPYHAVGADDRHADR